MMKFAVLLLLVGAATAIPIPEDSEQGQDKTLTPEKWLEAWMTDDATEVANLFDEQASVTCADGTITGKANIEEMIAKALEEANVTDIKYRVVVPLKGLSKEEEGGEEGEGEEGEGAEEYVEEQGGEEEMDEAKKGKESQEAMEGEEGEEEEEGEDFVGEGEQGFVVEWEASKARGVDVIATKEGKIVKWVCFKQNDVPEEFLKKESDLAKPTENKDITFSMFQGSILQFREQQERGNSGLMQQALSFMQHLMQLLKSGFVALDARVKAEVADRFLRATPEEFSQMFEDNGTLTYNAQEWLGEQSEIQDFASKLCDESDETTVKLFASFPRGFILMWDKAENKTMDDKEAATEGEDVPSTEEGGEQPQETATNGAETATNGGESEDSDTEDSENSENLNLAIFQMGKDGKLARMDWYDFKGSKKEEEEGEEDEEDEEGEEGEEDEAGEEGEAGEADEAGEAGGE